MNRCCHLTRAHKDLENDFTVSPIYIIFHLLLGVTVLRKPNDRDTFFIDLFLADNWLGLSTTAAFSRC